MVSDVSATEAVLLRAPAGQGRPWTGHDLHVRICDALRADLTELPTAEELASKPLLLHLAGDLPSRVRVYAFTVTSHEAERNSGEYRVQLIIPGQASGSRARFDRSDAALPLLVGYVPEFDVFVLWDADLHDQGQGFAYSKGVQVAPATIYKAVATGVALQQRRLRPEGGPVLETVVAVRANDLASAIRARNKFSLARLLGEDS